MPDSSRDDFYVGYLPRAPRALAAWVRSRLVLLLAGGLVLAVVLTTAQRAFDVAFFEFGVTRTFEGVVRATPYPSLLVDRPAGGVSQYLLVAYGKHGAPAGVVAMDGRRVRIQGTLVYRDDRTMLEVDTAEPLPSNAGAPVELDVEELGAHTFAGEIVDSKCFLGVMKPGALKPHRSCATRCISGGIPPVLLVREPDGTASYLLLTDEDGGAVNDRVLHLIAEPVEVTGALRREGELFVLRADPATYRRIP